MKRKLLINLLLLLVLMMGAISMLSAADSHFCGNGYSCPGEPSDVNVAVVIPSTMVLKINGTTAPTDGRIEIGFIFHDTDAGTNWRAMTYDAGAPVPLLWTGTDGGSAMYGDNSMTDPIDGFLTNSPIYIYVYDNVADKFYTISSYKLRDNNSNLVTTFKSSYLYVTLEELLVYTSPVLTNPADGAVSQPLSLSLTWDAIPAADSYDLQVSTHADFSSPLVDMNITVTTRSISSLTNNTTYYWRVRAKIGSVYTDWSDAEFLTQLPTPSITSPSTGLTNINPKSASVGYSTVSGANNYIAKFHPLSGSDITVSGTANPLVATTLLPCVQYTVTVQATNTSSGNTSPESSSITMTTLPNAPTLTAPTNAAKNVALRPAFTWSPDGTCSVKYKLTLWEGANTTNVTINGYAVNTYTWTSDLKNFTTYSWTVTPINSSNQEGAVSATRTFTTEVACASLVSPANGAKGIIPGTDNLTFSQVAGGAEYTVKVFISGGADIETKTVAHATGQANNSVSMTPALYGFSTTYSWNVTVKDVDNNTKVCGTWTFTTPPAAPTLVLPANNANNVSLNPTMRLGHSGEDYTPVTNFEVDLQKTDGTTVETKTIARTTGDNTDFTWATALNNFTGYKWRARSKTSEPIYSGWSAWSDFTTEVACPTLVSPANDAKGVIPATDKLTFNSVTGGKEYTVDVKVFGGSLVESLTAVAGTGTTYKATLTPGSYNYSTKYEWTVKVKDNFDNVKSSCGTWTFTTPPAAPTLVSPANNAINVVLIPSFEVGHNGANYAGVTQFQVIVRNVPDAIEAANFSVTRNAGGNTTTFSISPATDLKGFTAFKWKARSLNSDGIYSDWSTEYTFETEVACPSPIKPTNNQKFVVINSDMEWSSVTGASTYQLLVSKNANMSSPFINVTQAGTTYNPAADFEYRINYYWTVKITDTHGNTKTCGPWTFETELDSPRLSSPANNATCVPVQDATGFQWQAYTDATKYDLQYSKVDNDWAHATSFTNLTVTNKAFSGLDRNATYYWRVQAWVGGAATGYSGAYSFTTIDNPVVLTSPADNSCGLNTSVDFAWNAITGTTKYTVQVTTDPTVVTWDFTETPATNNVTINGLQKGKEYYWRVVSDKCGSNDLTEAEILTFRVIPSEPSLVSPADNAVEVSSWGDLEITGAQGADGYQIIISDNSGFGTTAFEYLGSDVTPTYNGLNSNTHYYWKARAYQTCGATNQYGAWSNVFEFDTKLLGPPQIKYPTDGAKYILLDVDLEWYTVPTVSYYALQVSTDPTFTDADDQVVNEAKVFGLKYSLKGLDYGTTYYWRLRSVIAEEGVYEESGWSKAYIFTTIPAIDIEGAEEVCVGIDNIQIYTVDAIPDVTYTWTVTGGSIVDVGNATDNEITVNWSAPGTGTIKVIRSGAVWGNFTDSGSLDVIIRAVGTIDITTDTDTYYENKFCANEKIVFTATINNPNIKEGDLQDYYWDFGNGNIVSKKLSTKFGWANPGTYTAKFYARTNADSCAEYTKTMTIVVTGDCAVTALLASDNNICNGAASALFETYVFGGAGGSLATDYTYKWAPAASFLNPTQKDGFYLQTSISKYVDFYATDKNGEVGHLNFKVLLRPRPVPDIVKVLTVPNSIAFLDFKNGDVAGNYKLVRSYGCTVCTDWTLEWLDKDYLATIDPDKVPIALGINTFYLTVTNDQGCDSKLYRGVVYRARSKEIMEHDYITGQNATAVMFAYPNPVVNNLNVFAEFEKEANITCTIVNLEGKVVKTFNSYGKIYDTTLDVNDLPVGTYILSVETNDDAVVWKFNKN